MQVTSCAIFLMTFFAFFAVSICRPSSLRGDDSINYDPEQESYLPTGISCNAILDALKERPSNLLPSDYKTTEKRTAAIAEGLDGSFPDTDSDDRIAGIKRRIFWQPLGYMPAAARAHNGPIDAALRANQGVSSNVFRYG